MSCLTILLKSILFRNKLLFFIAQATAEQIRLAQMIYDKNDADFEDKVKQVSCEGKNSTSKYGTVKLWPTKPGWPHFSLGNHVIECFNYCFFILI